MSSGARLFLERQRGNDNLSPREPQAVVYPDMSDTLLMLKIKRLLFISTAANIPVDLPSFNLNVDRY